MQAQHTPLPGFETVFKRAFARDPAARYASCEDLIAAARAPKRRSRWRLAVAGAAVMVAVAVALLLLTRGGAERLPAGSGVVALDADGVSDFVSTTAAPSNVAVGEGAVWVLDSDTETVARIDLQTRDVRRFTAGSRPTDLAVGAGAVVGRSTRPRPGARDQRHDGHLARRPALTEGDGERPAATTLERLRPRPERGLSEARRRCRGGVGDRRRQPDPPHRPVHGQDRSADSDRAAPGRHRRGSRRRVVRRIDRRGGGQESTPRRTGSSDRIPVDSGWLSGIAVGGGAVWATSPQDGRLWRIEPGPRPRLHAVKVGGWLSFLAYGAGAAWVAEYLGGVVTRVDARTNAMAARVTVGAVQALAASGGTAWVSVAGVTGRTRCRHRHAGRWSQVARPLIC